MTEQLFDPDDFKSRQDRHPSSRRKPAARRLMKQVTVFPIEAGWSLIADSRGVHGYQHAIKAVLTHGSVRTHCDIVGHTLDPRDDLFVAERCAVCEDHVSN